MYCNQCGTENADNAVFCKSCGKRIDGKLICPSCGKEVEADSVFCGFCGKRIVSIQPKAVPAAVRRDESAVSVVRHVDWRKILKIIATSAALATALFSLIFVFCMGLSAATSTTIMSESNGNSGSIFLYYYFGDAYSELEQLVPFSASDIVRATMYTPVVLGTIISAATLIAVIVSSIIAIVYGIKNLLGKSENNGARAALAAFASFVVGSSLLLALNNNDIAISYYDYYISFAFSMSCALSDATIAGIVLGSVSIAIYLGCMVAVRGRQLLKADIIAKLVTSLVMIAFVSVIAGVLTNPTYGMKAESMSVGDKMKVGIPAIMAALGSMNATDGTLEVEGNQIVVYILNLFSLLALISIMIVIACILVRAVMSMTDDNFIYSPVALNSVITILAVLFIAMTVIGADQFVATVSEYGRGVSIDEIDVSGVEFTYAVPIVVLVFSVLSLIASIVHRVLCDKLSRPVVTVNIQQ